ncbi:MAG: hypothetical protein ABSF67_10365 [Roseiarcus sp.]|jgi:hypothetical protein
MSTDTDHPWRQLLANTIRTLAQVEEAHRLIAKQLAIAEEAAATTREFAENVARTIIIAAAPTREAYVQLGESPAYDEAIRSLLADANAPTPDFS